LAGLVLRRLLLLVPTMLGVSFAIFSLIALIPGDAAETLAGGIDAQPEVVEQIRSELNLDDPFLTQYGRWISNAVQGDFGNSLTTGDSIATEIGARLPVTLGLITVVFTLALALSLLVGIAGGLRPGSLLDRGLLFGSSATISMPSFWVALVLVTIFAVQLRWVPPFGYEAFLDGPGEWAKRIVLPAVALCLAPAAILARQLRSAVADTMQSAYIRTAWAKGGSTRQVVVGHALKNSAIPMVTVFGVQIGTALGSTVIIERIFSIPGIGSYLLTAVFSQDLPVVQAVAMMFVVVNVGVNLAVDIAYGILNPKVRVS
jgi:peptide/nickel transport system permease protein